MGQVRWLDRFGPPSLVLSTALMLAVIFPTAIQAGPPVPKPGTAPKICPSFDVLAVARAATSGPAGRPEIEHETVLASTGAVTGRRLALATSTGTKVGVSLPAESFVAPAAGGVVIYGLHTSASGSEIRAVSLESGCEVILARPQHVVRSALLDPTGTALYVHAVTRDSRADVGVTRLDLASGTANSVIDPLPADERFGPTFATELRWSVEGDALAVQSCGMSRCRTRILDVASGTVETYAGAGHGTFVGLTRSTLFVLDKGHWSPIPLLAIERGSGTVTTIAEEVHSAALSERGGLPVLAIETSAGTQEVIP